MTPQPTARQFFPGLQHSATTALAPLQREFNRLLDELASGWNTFTEFEFAPTMDLRDLDEAIEITMELPGIAMEDVEVRIEDNLLTVRGEKKSLPDAKPEDRRMSERAYGAFSRTITLPSSVQSDKVTATLDKGVLRILAPKDGGTKAKTIPVKSVS